MFHTKEGAKRTAQLLRKQATAAGLNLSLSRCQHLLACHLGYDDWHDAMARIERGDPLGSHLNRHDGIAEILSGLGVNAGGDPSTTSTQTPARFVATAMPATIERSFDPILDAAYGLQAEALGVHMHRLAPMSPRRIALVMAGIVLGVLAYLPAMARTGSDRRTRSLPGAAAALRIAADPALLAAFMERIPPAVWQRNLASWPNDERLTALDFWGMATGRTVTYDEHALRAALEGDEIDPGRDDRHADRYPLLPWTAPVVEIPWLMPRSGIDRLFRRRPETPCPWPCDAFITGVGGSGKTSFAAICAGRIAAGLPGLRVSFIGKDIAAFGHGEIDPEGGATVEYPPYAIASIFSAAAGRSRPMMGRSAQMIDKPVGDESLFATDVFDPFIRWRVVDTVTAMIARAKLRPADDGDLIVVDDADVLFGFPASMLTPMLTSDDRVRFWFITGRLPAIRHVGIFAGRRGHRRPMLASTSEDAFDGDADHGDDAACSGVMNSKVELERSRQIRMEIEGVACRFDRLPDLFKSIEAVVRSRRAAGSTVGAR